jgi:methyl-accepting chemotaxis protein
MNTKYTREHWVEFKQLRALGFGQNAALIEMGIPIGSLGNLKKRFGDDGDITHRAHKDVVPAPDQISGSFGQLAQELNDYTNSLLDLTKQMSDLCKYAHGLALLDKTLRQLESKQAESEGLRRRLSEFEREVLSRAMVVHSTDNR